MKTVFSIGQAAKKAGVSVQTLRHYDKLRLLVPSCVTASGQRRYSAGDCDRLQLIRALREVGFDLATIRQVLYSELDAAEAVEMRCAALEAEQRALSRRRLVLRAAMDGQRKDVLDRLHQKHVLARLDRLEREAFLARHLGWVPRDTPASEAIWRAATCDLPEEMDDAALECWLELAEIAADDGFHETLKRQFELGQAMIGPTGEHSNGSFERLLIHVAGTIRGQRDSDGAESRALLDAWLDDCARRCSREPDGPFIQGLLDRFEASRNARIDRYWELVSKLKRLSYDPTYARAFDWIVNALRTRASVTA